MTTSEHLTYDGYWNAVYVIAGLFLFPFGLLLWGWMFSVLWVWFVVPVFSLPPLTVAQAVGFRIVAMLATRGVIHREDTRDYKQKTMDYLLRAYKDLVFMNQVEKEYIKNLRNPEHISKIFNYIKRCSLIIGGFQCGVKLYTCRNSFFESLHIQNFPAIQ